MSTSLLDDLWAEALDPSYAQVSAVAAAHAVPVDRARQVLGSLAAAALVGGAVALGVTQAGLQRPASQAARAELLADVRTQEQTAAGLETTTTRLRAAVDVARAHQLTTSAAGTRVAAEIAALQAATAGVAVTGPGVEVRVADAPPPTSDEGRVRDTDLQQLVNALWAAGAEAVAVDGQRLGPASAIRTAGDAILVDFRPVSSPYVVSAIGSPNGLQTGYAASDAASLLDGRAQLGGISVVVTPATSLSLPAATTAAPAVAQPIGGTP